eukprot:8773864-Lingulodinium_polyedra.AAC.1
MPVSIAWLREGRQSRKVGNSGVGRPMLPAKSEVGKVGNNGVSAAPWCRGSRKSQNGSHNTSQYNPMQSNTM